MNKIIVLMWLSMFIQCQPQKINKSMVPTVDNKFEIINTEEAKRIIINDNKTTTFVSAKIGSSYTEYHKNSYFMIIKNYYPSRNIKNKGIAFNEGSPIGIWYYFDESGKLTKEENTDEGYSFTPEKVIIYCEKNKIELPKGYHDSGFYTRIRKDVLNGKKVWVIEYLIPDGDIQKVVLDGQSGTELEKKVVPFVSS
ncbi:MULTISPECIES: hypothetical protein [unclassified Chryseobacterium]|uniref:hypothetical protein n=1 Tax=unclassified Chryseobacterium TaxID=2593645 RepID=UPI000D848333|nr:MULTISPECIES: hypothetical protein [unclassified Chryseobacterium]PWW16256.1 hypothetical protein DEU40_13123 [Chryseobacterium sp. AG844]